MMNTLVRCARAALGFAAVVCLGIGMIAGCASTGLVRAPLDVPDSFLVGEPDGSGTTTPAPGLGCGNPMIDPRDGTRLTLVRSSEGMGDYEVKPWLYGVGVNEVLRIDCATGRAVGIYRRQ